MYIKCAATLTLPRKELNVTPFGDQSYQCALLDRNFISDDLLV